MSGANECGVFCSACGSPATRRAGRLWCAACGIWLQLHEPSGQWVSPAEDSRRRRERDAKRRVQATAEAVAASLKQARELLLAGWRVDTAQRTPRDLRHLRLALPPGAPDVSAHLHPPTDSRDGWHVEIHDRVDHASYPLYTAGGVHAAAYPDLPRAVAAAVTALRLAIGRHRDNTTHRGEPK